MNAPATLMPPQLERTQRPARFTAEDYLLMAEHGVFGDRHIELVDGELVEMAPAYTPHGEVLMVLGAALLSVYPRDVYQICGDVITLLGTSNVRAPDVAIRLRSDAQTFRGEEIILAVEISASTLGIDLVDKARDYARSGIPTYWVVDVLARATHVLTQPTDDGYASRRVVPFDAPLVAPEVNATVTLA